MIIDCHVHSGKWTYRLLQDTGLNYFMSDYWEQYDEVIGKAIFFPSDQKNNIALLEDVLTNSRSYMAYWVDPINDNINRTFDIVSVNPKIVALKFHADIDRVNGGVALNCYAPYIEFAAFQNMPIIVHCGTNKATSSWLYLAEVANKYPKVKFVAAHLGGKTDTEQYEAINSLCVLKNVYFDSSSVKYPYMFVHAVETVGTNRILFGSDWPIMSPISALGAMSDSLIEEEIAQIKLNPYEVFKIEKDTDGSGN
jgi:predicted TIM-barrel fold metal-dependent hydrolase